MSGVMACSDLRGRRVLVVESEMLVPFTIYRAMERLGAEVVGPVGFPDDVLMLAGSGQLDGAILDSRMRPEERAAVHHVLDRLHVPYVEACGCMNCMSGINGCYRLSDAEDDLALLGRALFGGAPSGLRLHRHRLAAACRNYRPTHGRRSPNRSAPPGDGAWSNPL